MRNSMNLVVFATAGFLACAQAFQVSSINKNVGLSTTTHHSQFTSLASSSSSTDSVDEQKETSTPPVPTPVGADNPLIALANEFIYNQNGFYCNYDESMFSEEFVFRGPYIGPLNKKDYLATMDAFKIYEAIPDISPNVWGFSIDPTDPNRVWFMVRNTGSFTGKPLNLAEGVAIPPNGKVLEGCPETFSIIFDDEKKVKHYTVGYVADRFQGNTSGTGAAVGIFNAFGVPFPEPGPLLKFSQWLATEVLPNENGPYSYSVDNIPSWWKSTEKASEGYR